MSSASVCRVERMLADVLALGTTGAGTGAFPVGRRPTLPFADGSAEEGRPGVDVQNRDAEPLASPAGPVAMKRVLDRVRPGDDDDLPSAVRRHGGREGGQRVVLGHLADGFDVFRNLLWAFAAIAAVVGMITIANTFTILLAQRRRQIGLLRAVGLSRRKLRTMITLESVAIALLGAVLGMVVGLVIGVVLRQSLKDDLTVLSLPLSSLVIFLVVAVIFGVLAAIVPAIRASRMKVLQAIATE